MKGSTHSLHGNGLVHAIPKHNRMARKSRSRWAISVVVRMAFDGRCETSEYCHGLPVEWPLFMSGKDGRAVNELYMGESDGEECPKRGKEMKGAAATVARFF